MPRWETSGVFFCPNQAAQSTEKSKRTAGCPARTIKVRLLAEQLGTCDKVCVIRYLGRVSKGQMRGIDEAVRIQLGYYIPEQAEKKRQGKCRKDGEDGDG